LFRGEIANLSETGCFVKTRARLNFRRHDEVELRFTIKGDSFNILARIVSASSEAGARFEFTQIEPGPHKKLLRLVEELQEEIASK
jgi:c-di-GMP-binding flagellar brake protein YcgR